jgi:hypothetical protein
MYAWRDERINKTVDPRLTCTNNARRCDGFAQQPTTSGGGPRMDDVCARTRTCAIRTGRGEEGREPRACVHDNNDNKIIQSLMFLLLLMLPLHCNVWTRATVKIVSRWRKTKNVLSKNINVTVFLRRCAYVLRENLCRRQMYF